MTRGSAEIGPAFWLLCRVGSRLCALPLDSVVETMRPLPVEPLAGGPRSVIGLSVIRGAPTPVIDARQLFDEPASPPRRLVTITTGGRIAALLVDDVVGVRSIGAETFGALPPLLHDAAGEIVSAIGMLDAELLLVLQAARLVPDAPGAAGAAA